MRKPEQSGFTLIEISIVLVIIGLIVGGVIVGRSMIRQTQLMSAPTDAQNYIAAMKAFQEKYNALPGDMANATTYWGFAGGGAGDNYTTDCYGSVGTGTQTCNGNGDGQIGWCFYEANRAWQHLANAGLIQGAYNQSGNECWSSVIGVDVPASKIAGYRFFIGYRGTILPGDTYDYPNTLNHILYFSALSNTSVGLTGPELYAMDSKFDDGLPATGNIIASAQQAAWNGCVTNPNGATSPVGAVYNSSSSGANAACVLFFKTGF